MGRAGRGRRPFGAWASPISARQVAEGARRIDDIAAAGHDAFCWIERRPEEGGRNVLVCRGADGEVRTLTPDGFDVRSRVHEYGGGAFCLLSSSDAPAGDRGASDPRRTTGATTAPLPPCGARELPHAFVNFRDQRVYLAIGGSPIPLTPADGARYADLVHDRSRHRLIAVQERPDPAGGEEIAALVAISLPASTRDSSDAAHPLAAADPSDAVHRSEPLPPTELVSGADFYSSPRLPPDGARLAWLSWNHPDMPWDATELRLADLDDAGRPAAPRLIAGGGDGAPEAVQQPAFDAHGRLTFISDRTGWWNLYCAPAFRPASGAPPRSGEPEWPARPLHLCAAEFGVPPWLFGMSTYAHTASGIVAACCERGVWRLLLIPSAGDAPSAGSEPGAGANPGTGEPVPIPTPYTSITWVRPAGPAAVLFLGAAPDRPAELVRLSLPAGRSTWPAAALPDLEDLAAAGPALEPEDLAAASPDLEVLAATGPAPDSRYLSRGRPIDFPSTGGRRAFGFFYPPKNDDARAPDGARPPLIVKSHGGPTSAAEHVYDTGVQYWTSRGFAVVDVNYGGSTGYGRAYRESLRGRWGLVDVEDCAAAAEALAARGEVDARRLLIRGGSAGGYTTLAALAFKDTFAAGASHYGVADLAALARDTHKFESRYLDRLVGPYPERSDLYDQRSPLSAREGFSCPVIFFQGSEDRIVPPNQAESMVEALRAGGVPVAYLLFAGEQHGFRRAGNIVRALEAELSFYGQVLGFEPAGGIEPVPLLGPA